MSKKLLFFILILNFLIFKNVAFSNDKQNFKIVDINFIMNQSIAGKDILKTLDKENKKKIEEFKKIEKNLADAKNKILSQKNILSDAEFKLKVDEHQIKVNDYQNKQKKNFENLNKKKLELSNKLLKEINDILVKYSKDNSIDLILKKETILISQKNSDITRLVLENLDNKIKKID
ncbi:OmpH family outer membrane protein [Candidatus Pelagibacter sp.]|uniref:OmpH family outer membrane protein n=1 Tax=Candidatus Pelagibacter sp. TaxID=2024849 RepID=UPI003F868CE3